ncbi:MAG: phosphonate transport system substrate-binding protein [Burkholderiaceae bacterium]|jgi:phosphonate transport system substrate-binding protein
MINKLAISLSAVMALSTAYAQDINLGIISTESTTNLKADWQPLIDDMSKKTGYNIKAFFASDYAGVIEAMRFNKVQVAWFGNKSAMEAVDRAKGEIFAQMVNADGTQGYYSHMIVHKDSPVNNLDDLLKMSKNLTFSNGDPNSTSGFLVPSYYVFSKNKVDPKTMFKAVRGANHEANALAVANKQIDVATNNSETLGRIKDRMPEKASMIKVIWTSPLIPSDPMVIRSDLDPAVKTKIKDFFYGYGSNDTEKATLMQLQKITGFKVSSNDQLKPIRQLELFKARNKLEADTTMSAADKTAKLADIDQQLAALN